MTAAIRYTTPVLSAILVSLVSTVAAAHPEQTGAPAKTHAGVQSRTFGDAPMRLHLAEVEIVNTTPQATPAPAPAAAPVVAAPVAEPPRKTTVVNHQETNYMSTIAINALMGALAGALVGGALYYLADDQTHAQRIGYWAAGGVLVGTGAGLVQVVVQERRADSAMLRLPSDPAPTFRLALLTQRF